MVKRELAKLYSLLVLAIIISISVVSINVYANEYINERLGINLNSSQGLTLSDVSTDEEDCKKDNECLLVFNSQENPKISFTILIQHGKQFEDNCECESLLEFAQYEYKKKYESLEGFTLIDDNQTTLNGNIPSMQMEYELARSTGDSRHLVVWTTINDIFYTISYHHIKKHDTIPDDYSSRLPIFKQVLKSITFFEPTENIQSIQPQQEKKKPSFMVTDTKKDNNIYSLFGQNNETIRESMDRIVAFYSQPDIRSNPDFRNISKTFEKLYFQCLGLDMFAGFKERYGIDCNIMAPHLTGEFYSDMDKFALAYEHWVNVVSPVVALLSPESHNPLSYDVEDFNQMIENLKKRALQKGIPNPNLN